MNNLDKRANDEVTREALTSNSRKYFRFIELYLYIANSWTPLKKIATNKNPSTGSILAKNYWADKLLVPPF